VRAPSLPSYRICRCHRRGAALVLVLAFIVLLTCLVLAFFSRATSERQVSNSSANQTNVALLAQGGLDTIVADLKQEIAAGSTLSTLSGVTIYNSNPTAAASPSTLTPALAGSSGSGGLENLVKRSAYGLKFYPTDSSYDTAAYPPSNRAAGPSTQAGTTVPSFNGRAISLARWNKPLLLLKAAPASDTDLTPVNTFTASDWIIVARDGSNPTAWNNNLITSRSSPASAIGRYAYVIYDEGGLLDMNVAGYPSVSTTAQVGRKGSTAFADLTQIPGISNFTSTQQSKLANNIVGWRNFSSASANGRLGTFLSSNAYSYASGLSYYNSILSNSNGFLRVSSTTLNGSQSDRMLSGRQALIALFLRGIASTAADRANLQVALQYLGSFSRELNRPTWKPSTPAGSIIDYKALAKTPTPETSTAINRDLTSVRVASAFIRSDGTMAVAGEALLKTRFALTRLSTLQNPASTTAQRDFGLLWDAANNRWTYIGASGGKPQSPPGPAPAPTPQSRILALDEVAQGKVLRADGSYETDPRYVPYYREPNFFEILKAVILNGSVGLGSGAGNSFVVSETKYYVTTNDASADYQIMQIGVNIIDAWDSDNVPTFFSTGPGTGNEIAGIENLPYLNKLVLNPYWTNPPSGTDVFDAWLIPSLWNPHQNASAAPSTQSVRIAMTSGSMSASAVGGSYGNTTFTSEALTAPASIQVRANAFQFPVPPNPAIETAPNVGSVSQTTFPGLNYDGFHFIFNYSDPNASLINADNCDRTYPTFTGNTTFEMQINTNGTWKAYQSWKGCAQPPTPLACKDPHPAGGWKNNKLMDPEFLAIDPRTVRFGVWGSDAYDTPAKGKFDYTDGAEDSMDQRNAGPESIFGLKPQGSAFALDPNGKAYLYAANSEAGDQYTDLDGVKRQGDWAADGIGTANKKTVMYGLSITDRPQMLSAPFQSVAELGQVFRDQPWKTLNFTLASSGDAGLLDAFTLQDVPMVAGKTSLNTRQSPVLAAILSKATTNLAGSAVITSTQRDNIVTALRALTAADPMISKSELVTRLAADPSITALGNKEARECVVRAFSDACQTRTWNLMIDLIAQSGRYPPIATNLSQFVVEGEKRYWLHLAIDRFTGEVIDRQLEVVTE
jgi:Tfp pilus assembly protein PilX